MFPYVGSPVFYNGPSKKHRWKFFSSVPEVSVEGMVVLVFAKECSNSTKGVIANPRGRRRRWNSLPVRRLSTKHFGIRALTRSQKALCDWPNDSALQCLLNRSYRWNFDPFLLNCLSRGHPVWFLGCKLFELYNFAHIFHLEWTSIFYCLRLIEHGYPNNRFHNSVHAADVAQALHCFLNETMVCAALSPLEKLGSILAAFGHDLYHRGLNQKFLENSNHFLCSLYHNVSVLENFHWRCLVSILIESGLAAEFPRDQWRELLRIFELLILATDMQRQQEYLNQFKVFLRCNDPSTIGNGSSSNIRLMQPILKCDGEEERLFILQILIKCADIGNPCRPWKLSQEWSYRASTEFFSQGDEERRLNMPLTSFCDRYATSVPKIQSGFMEFIAQPLFSDWDRYIQSPLSETLMRNLKENCQHWTDLLQSEILAGAVSGRRDSVTSSTIRSSLEEMADMELQKPETLQRRRVSASADLPETGFSTPSITSPKREDEYDEEEDESESCQSSSDATARIESEEEEEREMDMMESQKWTTKSHSHRDHQ